MYVAFEELLSSSKQRILSVLYMYIRLSSSRSSSRMRIAMSQICSLFLVRRMMSCKCYEPLTHTFLPLSVNLDRQLHQYNQVYCVYICMYTHACMYDIYCICNLYPKRIFQYAELAFPHPQINPLSGQVLSAQRDKEKTRSRYAIVDMYVCMYLCELIHVL